MTRIAWLALRHGVPERWGAWTKGLQRCGFTVQRGTTSRPSDGDILVTWNRVQDGRLAADAFETRGLPVICTENATWGNDFAGRRWWHIALGRHNTAGRFPVGGPERWNGIGVALRPFRARDSGETVLLPQRGIGINGVAMPLWWTGTAREQWKPCRVRAHPGNRNVTAEEFESDLASAWRVITWGSGAAVRALMLGCHVVSEMPGWIAAQDNTDEGRLAMFRRIAWAQWQPHELATGEPIARLLDRSVRA